MDTKRRFDHSSCIGTQVAAAGTSASVTGITAPVNGIVSLHKHMSTYKKQKEVDSVPFITTLQLRCIVVLISCMP